MARTIEQIYNALIAEKETMSELTGLQPTPDTFQTFLNDLTSASKVAFWRLIFYVVAVGLSVHESLWDVFKAEVDAQAAAMIPGTERWYYEQSLIFQYGDALVYLDGKYVYNPVDATHRIIKRCAVVEVLDQVQIKIAKLDGGGLPIPLTSGEKTAFEEYIDEIKFAGTVTVVISEDGDLLKLEYDIYYNPLLLNSDGSLVADSSIYPVEDAINNYIGNLPFNGILFISELEDAIQAATGVVTYEKLSLQAKYGALAYADVDVQYGSNAGYVKIDPAYPLSAQLNYIPA